MAFLPILLDCTETRTPLIPNTSPTLIHPSSEMSAIWVWDPDYRDLPAVEQPVEAEKKLSSQGGERTVVSLRIIFVQRSALKTKSAFDRSPDASPVGNLSFCCALKDWDRLSPHSRHERRCMLGFSASRHPCSWNAQRTGSREGQAGFSNSARSDRFIDASVDV